VEAEYFSGTLIPIDKSTWRHTSTEVLETFCSGPQRLHKIRSTLRAEAIFIPGSLLRRVIEENVLFDFICSTGRVFYHVS
jgi:hypothetical protein